MKTMKEYEEEFDLKTEEVVESFKRWIVEDREFVKRLLRDKSLNYTNLAVLLLVDEGRAIIPKNIYDAQIEKINNMKYGFTFHSYPDDDGNMYLWIEEKEAPAE